MSKSDGNFFAMGDVLAKFPAEVIRFFLLNAHFRSQLDFSEDRLREAAAGFARLQRGTQRLLAILADDSAGDLGPLPDGLVSLPGAALAEAVAGRRRRFFAAMDDDFNSGGAIGELFGLVRDLNQYLAATAGRGLDPGPLQGARDLLAEADQVLGLFTGGLDALAPPALEPPAELVDLLTQREEARTGRDWAAADELRDRIQDHGWRVVDTPQGPRLEPPTPAS
jgi:cysteinyl-tRNA synthetase